MSFALRRLLLVAAAAAAVQARAAAAQAGSPVVTVEGPAGDTLRSTTPTFVIRTGNFPENDPVTTVTLQISRRSDFADLLYEEGAAGASASITVDHALPEVQTVFWRGVARLQSGAQVASDPAGPRVTPRWVELLLPGPSGSIVQTARPTFVWRSAEVSTPPGPWSFDLGITDASNRTVEIRGLLDTTFTPTFDLEANTSYRWSVTARLATGEGKRVESSATFVIISSTAPMTTLLYQNFPNPFPNASTRITCIWLDVRALTPVSLEVYDLRGNLVRRLIPGAQAPEFLTAGRYGRAASGSSSLCDERFSWDGTTDGGAVVPAGVYLLRLRADGTDQVRKIVFRGR